MDRVTIALFGVFCFMAGFMAASMYTWWVISTRRRGVKLMNGTIWFVPMSPEPRVPMTAAPSQEHPSQEHP